MVLPTAPVVLKACRCGGLFTGSAERVCPACDGKLRRQVFADTRSLLFFLVEQERAMNRWLEEMIWRE